MILSKRTFLLTALLSCVFLTPLTSADIPLSIGQARTELSQLLKKGELKTDGSRIEELALALPYEERVALYESYRKSAFMPSVRGLVSGFGGGARLNGDSTAGFIFLGIDSLASISVGYGMVMGIVYGISYGFSGVFAGMFGQEPSSASSAEAREKFKGLAPFVLGGLGVLAASRIAQVLQPIFSVNAFNSQLEGKLHSAKEFSMSVVPYGTPGSRSTGMLVAIRMEY